MTNTLLLSLSLKVNQWRSSCSGNTESFIKETQHVVFGLNDGNQEHHVLPKTTEQKRQHVEICLSSSTDEKSPHEWIVCRCQTSTTGTMKRPRTLSRYLLLHLNTRLLTASSPPPSEASRPDRAFKDSRLTKSKV